MAPISFRNSKIAYYGPHSCENCGVNIVRMGREWGGTAFTAPEGPIYPNTEWHPHVCDPSRVRKRLGNAAQERILADWPNANAFKVREMGWVILGERLRADMDGGSYLVISENQTFHDTPDSAWAGALRREEKSWPTWHLIDPSKYGLGARPTSELLMSLPECPA